MANRMYNQFQGTLEKGVVQLFAEVSFNGAGVATKVESTVNGGCKGIASVTKTATGVYDVVLQDSYVRTLSAHTIWKNLTGTAQAAKQTIVSVDNVTDPATPKITLKFFDAANAAVAPDAADVLMLTLSLSNSTAL